MIKVSVGLQLGLRVGFGCRFIF